MPQLRTLTVSQAVADVESGQLLLPGIQRPFVWNTRKIAALFDSLLRGYPIGLLLLWNTRHADNPQLRFFSLVTEYRGKETKPPGAHPKGTEQVYAVLDGQQRLTALNIGLRGSHAPSEHGVARRLSLDLDTEDRDAG